MCASRNNRTTKLDVCSSLRLLQLSPSSPAASWRRLVTAGDSELRILRRAPRDAGLALWEGGQGEQRCHQPSAGSHSSRGSHQPHPWQNQIPLLCQSFRLTAAPHCLSSGRGVGAAVGSVGLHPLKHSCRPAHKRCQAGMWQSNHSNGLVHASLTVQAAPERTTQVRDSPSK